MALEEDLPEKPDDRTIPKYKQIDKVGIPEIKSVSTFSRSLTYGV